MTTTIYVQNNTLRTLQFRTEQSGAPLAAERWKSLTHEVKPGAHASFLELERDKGITNGEDFFFTTTVNSGAETLALGQKLHGNLIGSNIWHSVAEEPWRDDRSTHCATWQVDGKSIEVKHRAYFTGGDDDIEYVFREDYDIPRSERTNLNVLAYNLYMRSSTLFMNGQEIRSKLLPGVLGGYDVLVFSEAFDNDVRKVLLDGLRPEYPYQTKVVDSASIIPPSNGGVIIVSRWPITREEQRAFGSVSAGSDALAAKGVLYARIDKDGKPYHVFGTHTQAWSTPEGAGVRARQFVLIREFIREMNIPADEPVLIAGDLNVDLMNFPDEYRRMLELLNASQPPIVGYDASFDPSVNRLAAGETRERLDYVLYANDHQQPRASYNQVRMIRSREEWKQFATEKAYWDLSDHFALFGRLEF